MKVNEENYEENQCNLVPPSRTHSTQTSTGLKDVAQGLVTAACLLVLLSVLILTLWEGMAGGGAGHKRDRGARERALDTV